MPRKPDASPVENLGTATEFSPASPVFSLPDLPRAPMARQFTALGMTATTSQKVSRETKEKNHE